MKSYEPISSRVTDLRNHQTVLIRCTYLNRISYSKTPLIGIRCNNTTMYACISASYVVITLTYRGTFMTG